MNFRSVYVWGILGFLLTVRLAGQGTNVTIVMKDSTRVEGELALVTDELVGLRGEMVPAPDLGPGTMRMVPRNYPIDSVSYVIVPVLRPRSAGWGERILAGTMGSLVGMIFGGYIASVVSDKHDLSIIGNVMLGGAIGAAIGGLAGQGLVDMPGEEELMFYPGIPGDRESLAQYARSN